MSCLRSARLDPALNSNATAPKIVTKRSPLIPPIHRTFINLADEDVKKAPIRRSSVDHAQNYDTWNVANQPQVEDSRDRLAVMLT